MKRFLCSFLSLITVIGIFASTPISVSAASSGTCGNNITWNLDNNGTFTLRGSGNMNNYWSSSSVPWNNERTSIKKIVISDGITSISNYAFCDCSNITEITLPNTVASLGSSAFKNCTNLNSVNLGNNIIDFGTNVFQNTSYYNNSDNWENGVLYIDNYLIKANTSVSGNYTVKDGTIAIVSDTFVDCTNLTKVLLPESLLAVGGYAFSNCTNLETIVIPKNVIVIDIWAFRNCMSLKSITILGNDTTIGSYAMGYYYNSTLGKRASIDGFTIYGLENSKAEEYAYENYFTFVELCTHKNCTWVIDQKATCTEQGSKHKECTSCKEVFETETISATGHTESEWITDKKTTVNAVGSKHKECTECGETLETAKIDQLKCATPRLSKVTNTKNSVKFTWKKVTGADSYTVYKKTGSGSWKKIAEDVKGTSYTDKKVKKGVNYKYTVTAENEAGLSGYNKNGLSIKRLTTPTLKRVSSAKAGVTIKWNKVTGATGYIVMRKTGNGSWKEIATVKGNSKATYLDKKAKKGTTYKYTVKAYYGSSESAYNTNGLKIKDRY